MPTYLVTYHGGDGMPASPEALEKVVAAFSAWVASAGDAIVDPGAPLAASKTVSASEVKDGYAEGPAGGYTVLEADSIDAAVELVKSHPFVTRGGSLEVSEAVKVA
jgi:hypothetical protein